MGYIRNDFEQLKKELQDIIGEEIVLIEPIRRRGKKRGKCGVLDGVYKEFFRVVFDDNKTANYNYVDLFTKDIEIKVYADGKFKFLDIPKPISKKASIYAINEKEYLAKKDNKEKVKSITEYLYGPNYNNNENKNQTNNNNTTE